MIRPAHPLITRIPLFIAALFFLLAVISVQYDDVTFDEPDHLNYGIHLLHFKSDRYVEGRDFNTTMPVTALNAIPRAVEQLFNSGLQKNDWGESDVKNGRYVTILVSLVLLFYIFLFAKAIAGFGAGCWAMFLAALDPNILAHARLVTTDIYGTLAFVMTLYHLYEWLVNKKQQHFYAWCFAIAFAQCCKVNNILLYFISLIAIIAFGKSVFKKTAWKQLLLFIGIQILVINIFFLFYRTGMALADFQFKSSFFQQLQEGFFARIPLPFPKSFIDTFDLVQYECESFDGIPMNYLNGELRYKQGFWNYYFVCFGNKTPIYSLLLILLSPFIFLREALLRKYFIFFFLIPCATVFYLISSSSVQTGYRYLLPDLSLGLVLCGAIINAIPGQKSVLFKSAFLILPLVTVFTTFPNFISYTNSFIGHRRPAYSVFADSNIHWGQRQKKIRKVLAENPQYIFEPAKPVNGTIVVEINNLVGGNDPEKFKWLREHYKPIRTIDDCYLVFEVRDAVTQ